MAVIIENFGMPSCCVNCNMFDGECCFITMTECEDETSYRNDDCPLKEVYECEAGDLLPKYINALRKCAKEHEKDFVPTFNIRTSDLCNDTAKLLEQIHHQQNILAYAHDMEVSVKQAEKELRVECEAEEDCVSRKNILESLNGAFPSTDWNKALFRKIVLDTPSVYPKSECKAEDCINRIKEEMLKYGFTAPDMTVTEFVEDILPSVYPKSDNPKEEHTCETCAYGEWKRKGWTMDMADDKCGGCCSWNDKWEKISSVYPKSDKPSGKYEYHIDHTDCIWYGSDEGCPVTCSQYRDGWNDAMDYIFKNGNGYQPYRHDA